MTLSPAKLSLNVTLHSPVLAFRVHVAGVKPPIGLLYVMPLSAVKFIVALAGTLYAG